MFYLFFIRIAFQELNWYFRIQLIPVSGSLKTKRHLKITLLFDLSTYLKTKPREDYLKGKITFNPARQDSITRNIRIRTRGIFRHEWCYYAPIELNFKNADFGFSDLNSINKIKLVPQCTAGSESEKNVLVEYLIYKMFNVMTDTSFKVRLLVINYVDSENKKKPFTQYGFFIEPLKMLAARTNSVEIVSTGSKSEKHLSRNYGQDSNL